jgi:hypothetical protein
LDGEGEMSPSKPDEPPVQDIREMYSSQGIYEVVIQRNKLGYNHYENQLTLIKFPSVHLPDVMAAM